MKKRAFMFALSFVFIFSSGVMARSIPGAPNEVYDPWFQDTETGWYIEGTWELFDNPGNLPGNYFDPGREAGDIVFLRTIVDDYDGLWDPTCNQKEIDLSLFAHIVGDGYVKVRFDWWLDENIERPSNDPNDPLTPTPDGWSEWYLADAAGTLPGDFSDGVLKDGEDPGWFTPDGQESFLLSIHETWDIQPRWVSIEIEVGICPTSQIGGEALITGIDFEAQCVPEPLTMSLLAMGGLALLRRRK